MTAPAEAAAVDCRIAAVGDIAGSDYKTGANLTAALVQREKPKLVLALGDLAYNDGTPAQFAAYYEPGWGKLKSITKPTPGNHEWNTKGVGYFAYFNNIPSFYSFNVCGWHFISVNQYAGIPAAARFITTDAAKHRGLPLGVYWHEPRFSSGVHGSSTKMQPLWSAAVAAGARIVLNGHDHNYESFLRMDAAGNYTPSGTREFVSGNGGHAPRAIATVRKNSAVRVAGTPGVLFLTLRSTSYSWTYKNVKGVVGDGGSTSFG